MVISLQVIGQVCHDGGRWATVNFKRDHLKLLKVFFQRLNKYPVYVLCPPPIILYFKLISQIDQKSRPHYPSPGTHECKHTCLFISEV